MKKVKANKQHAEAQRQKMDELKAALNESRAHAVLDTQTWSWCPESGWYKYKPNKNAYTRTFASAADAVKYMLLDFAEVVSHDLASLLGDFYNHEHWSIDVDEKVYFWIPNDDVPWKFPNVDTAVSWIEDMKDSANALLRFKDNMKQSASDLIQALLAKGRVICEYIEERKPEIQTASVPHGIGIQHDDDDDDNVANAANAANAADDGEAAAEGAPEEGGHDGANNATALVVFAPVNQLTTIISDRRRDNACLTGRRLDDLKGLVEFDETVAIRADVLQLMANVPDETYFTPNVDADTIQTKAKRMELGGIFWLVVALTKVSRELDAVPDEKAAFNIALDQTMYYNAMGSCVKLYEACTKLNSNKAWLLYQVIDDLDYVTYQCFLDYKERACMPGDITFSLEHTSQKQNQKKEAPHAIWDEEDFVAGDDIEVLAATEQPGDELDDPDHDDDDVDDVIDDSGQDGIDDASLAMNRILQRVRTETDLHMPPSDFLDLLHIGCNDNVEVALDKWSARPCAAGPRAGHEPEWWLEEFRRVVSSKQPSRPGHPTARRAPHMSIAAAVSAARKVSVRTSLSSENPPAKRAKK